MARANSVRATALSDSERAEREAEYPRRRKRKAMDLTGQKFNELTVIGRAEDYVNPSGARYVQWLCQCSCGNTCVKRATALRSGSAKSCGCLRSTSNRGRGLIDLSGKRFGRCVVIERAEDRIDGRGKHWPMWRCLCDCGNEFVADGAYLRKGLTTSCGCDSEKSKEPSEDLTGQRFGLLSVVGFAGVVRKYNRNYEMWHCLCECGKTVDESGVALKRGDVRSCGCLATSYNEVAFGELLREYRIGFSSQVSYPDLVGEGGHPLRYDFCLRLGHDVLVELNGLQHYQPSNMFGGEDGFVATQRSDAMKARYAADRGIPLYVVDCSRSPSKDELSVELEGIFEAEGFVAGERVVSDATPSGVRNVMSPLSDELVEELVDKSLSNLPAFSHAKVEWRCKQGHTWMSEVAARSQGSGCPYCSGRLPVRGFSDLATTHPDIAAQLVDPSLAETVSAGSSKSLAWQCERDKTHVWMSQVRYRCGVSGRKSSGCPICSGHRSTSAAERLTLADVAHPVLKDAADAAYVGTLKPSSDVVVSWRCDRHGHEPYYYSMSVSDRIRGRGCPLCLQDGQSGVSASSDACDTRAVSPFVRFLVERFSDADVDVLTLFGICVCHVRSIDVYVAHLDGLVHGWSWRDEGNLSEPSSDRLLREHMRDMDAHFVVVRDESLWDLRLWLAMGAPLAKDWERSYSWLDARELSAISLPSDWQRTASFSRVTKHYQHELFFARELEFWSDDRFLDKRRDKRRMVGSFFANRYRYLHKLPDALTDAEILRGLRICGMVRGYTSYDAKPLAAFLAEHDDVKSVVDPCAGWGERMLCCAANRVAYDGCDINEGLSSGYDAMVSELGLEGVSFSVSDGATFSFGAADAVVTCPPYMGIERYSDLGAENLGEAEFAKWWFSVVENVAGTGCRYFCITTNQACKDVFSSAIEAAGFELESADVVGRGRASHFNRKGSVNTKREYEEFLVFERR